MVWSGVCYVCIDCGYNDRYFIATHITHNGKYDQILQQNEIRVKNNIATIFAQCLATATSTLSHNHHTTRLSHNDHTTILETMVQQDFTLWLSTIRDKLVSQVAEKQHDRALKPSPLVSPLYKYKQRSLPQPKLSWLKGVSNLVGLKESVLRENPAGI